MKKECRVNFTLNANVTILAAYTCTLWAKWMIARGFANFFLFWNWKLFVRLHVLARAKSRFRKQTIRVGLKIKIVWACSSNVLEFCLNENNCENKEIFLWYCLYNMRYIEQKYFDRYDISFVRTWLCIKCFQRRWYACKTVRTTHRQTIIMQHSEKEIFGLLAFFLSIKV